MLSDDKMPPLPQGRNIEEIRLEKESQILSSEAQEKELLVKEINQRIKIRRWTLVLAVIVILFMLGFLVCAMNRYFTDYPFGSFVFVHSSIVVVLVVTPIMSVSAITVTILIGSFRISKHKNSGGVDMTYLANEAAKSALGS